MSNDRYSSNVKEFQLLGSATHPTEKWLVLDGPAMGPTGFRAENTKETQRFEIYPGSAVRYIKFR